MSYFDDASLVMIPSGYKDQKVYSIKPLDGAGDLAFSRASSATRVASNGLIEKVRTNLILQSNTFSTTWTLTNASVTSGQAGYDGTNNAWLLSKSGAFGRAEQSLATTGLETFSVYVKAGSSNYTEITSNAGPYVGVNLTNGSIVAQSGVTPLVASVGSGWYRISIAYTKAASNVWRIIAGDAGSASSAAGSTGTILIQNAQAEAGDIATDYIATTSAAVSVGPVGGLPRLDYLNSTCPRLLLEPQRTNLAFYSEQLDNVEWSKTGGLTVSANQTTSPSGYADADKVIVGSNQFGELRSSSSSQAAGAYSASIFVKKGDLSWCVLQMTNGTDYARTWFNIETGVVGSNDSSVWTLNSSKIENYSNGWYRISITVTTTATTSNRLVLLAATGDGIFGAALNTYFFAWGGQVEAGAYATSYIPTLGTSVTRVADAASKTGISSLIGQTEGTVFVEINRTQKSENYQPVLCLQGASSAQLIELYFGSTNTLNLGVYNSGAQYQSASGVIANGTHKIAVAYKQNDFAYYIDGVQISTDNSGTVPALTQLVLGGFSYTSGYELADGIKQTLLFTTRLTNAQLAELTTL